MSGIAAPVAVPPDVNSGGVKPIETTWLMWIEVASFASAGRCFAGMSVLKFSRNVFVRPRNDRSTVVGPVASASAAMTQRWRLMRAQSDVVERART